MKHIFVVHSNITYLAALGVITYKKLDLSHVKIYSNVFIVDKPIPTEKFDLTPLKKALFNFRFNKWFNTPRTIDKQIDRFVGEDVFTAYVPSLPFPNSLLVTNPKCERFNFIEEGLSNYAETETLETTTLYDTQQSQWRANFKSKLKNAIWALRGVTPQLSHIPYLSNNYININNVEFYGFFPDTFKRMPANRIHVIELMTVLNLFKQNYNISNSTIILGTVPEQHNIEKYIENIEVLIIPKLITNNNDIYIKFHPRELNTTKIAIIKLMNNNKIKYQILPTEYMMELAIMKSKYLTMYGFNSTLNLYAERAGQKQINIDLGK